MPYNTFDPDIAASQAGTVNNSLDGLNIANGCPAQNANDAPRMLMANLRQIWNVISNPLSTIYDAFMKKTGGAFTGDITRDGRGAYVHYTDSSLLSGKVTVQPLGSPFPASPQEGDQVWEY